MVLGTGISLVSLHDAGLSVTAQVQALLRALVRSSRSSRIHLVTLRLTKHPFLSRG